MSPPSPASPTVGLDKKTRRKFLDLGVTLRRASSGKSRKEKSSNRLSMGSRDVSEGPGRPSGSPFLPFSWFSDSARGSPGPASPAGSPRHEGLSPPKSASQDSELSEDSPPSSASPRLPGPPKCSYPYHTLSQSSDELLEEPAGAAAGWTCGQVGQWLQSLGLERYVREFAERGVDGSRLLLLDGAKLKVRGRGGCRDPERWRERGSGCSTGGLCGAGRAGRVRGTPILGGRKGWEGLGFPISLGQEGLGWVGVPQRGDSVGQEGLEGFWVPHWGIPWRRKIWEDLGYPQSGFPWGRKVWDGFGAPQSGFPWVPKPHWPSWPLHGLGHPGTPRDDPKGGAGGSGDPKGRSQGKDRRCGHPKGGTGVVGAPRSRCWGGSVPGCPCQPAVPQALGVGSSQDRAVLKRRLKELSAAAERERKARDKADKQRDKHKKKAEQEQRRS
uniref:Sterile alpha motif domain containing 14 n=1 Tax=Junco hyemalis TaxID=40217 RepID=A0A8C5IVS6_JUNHY